MIKESPPPADKVIAPVVEVKNMFLLFKRQTKRLKRRSKIIKAIKKKAAKTQGKKIVEEKKKPKPIEMETKKISREGDVGMEFNQKMRVPSMITQKKTKEGKLRLLLQNFDTCPVT